MIGSWLGEAQITRAQWAGQAVIGEIVWEISLILGQENAVDKKETEEKARVLLEEAIKKRFSSA